MIKKFNEYSVNESIEYNSDESWEYNLIQNVRWNSEDVKNDVIYFIKEYYIKIVNEEDGFDKRS